MIAARTLNIFSDHAPRMRAANLAQTVNVIHSPILTKAQLVLTPTYHMFDLYQVHQDVQLVLLRFDSRKYMVGTDTVVALNASASLDSLGVVHVSLVNLDPNMAVTIQLPIIGKTVTGKLLTGVKVTDVNTSKQPDTSRVETLRGLW